MRFIELNFLPHIIPFGVQAVAEFPNGYGLSVCIFPGSYGYSEGKYECAVLKFTENDFKICYNTSITDDVIGFCDMEQVEDLLKQVENLGVDNHETVI